MRFNAIYGQRWESSYGPPLDDNNKLTPTAQTWAKALAELRLDDLSRGLHACLNRADGWPPTLPEFKALCQPPAAPHDPTYYRCPDLDESDEARTARRAAGFTAIAQIKTLLGMPK